jgi:hypothetical protein
MNTVLHQTLESLVVGEPQHHAHLAVFPLLGKLDRAADYVMLGEALARKLARVTEVSEGGSVPELLLDNPSDARVLLLDGDELVGARQNRVLNVTILVGPRTRTRIPVSCVERGRWSYATPEFETEDRMMHASARAAKAAAVTRSILEQGARHSDQGAVWEDIARKSASLGASSRSEAMRDVFFHVEEDLAGYRAAFRAVPRQVGAVFAIGGRAVGLELLDAPETFAASLGKLVASYALDAVEERGRPLPPPPADVATDLLRRAASLRCDEVPAVGEGLELRLHGPDLAGLALVAGDRVVHLSVLERRGARGDAAGGSSRGPGSPSLRRRRVAG